MYWLPESTHWLIDLLVLYTIFISEVIQQYNTPLHQTFVVCAQNLIIIIYIFIFNFLIQLMF